MRSTVLQETALSNIEYQVKKYGDSGRAKELAEKVKKEEYYYCAVNDFEK